MYAIRSYYDYFEISVHRISYLCKGNWKLADGIGPSQQLETLGSSQTHAVAQPAPPGDKDVCL